MLLTCDSGELWICDVRLHNLRNTHATSLNDLGEPVHGSTYISGTQQTNDGGIHVHVLPAPDLDAARNLGQQ